MIKKTMMEQVKFTEEDLKKVRVSADFRTLVIGRVAYHFPSVFATKGFWFNYTTTLSENTYQYFKDVESMAWLMPDETVASMASEGDLKESMDILSCFRAAIDEVVSRGAYLYGSEIKVVGSNENFLISNVYGMQDALYYAMQDCSSDDEDDLFGYFFGQLSELLWISEFYGWDSLYGLCRYFFDSYLPIAREADVKD